MCKVWFVQHLSKAQAMRLLPENAAVQTFLVVTPPVAVSGSFPKMCPLVWYIFRLGTATKPGQKRGLTSFNQKISIPLDV